MKFQLQAPYAAYDQVLEEGVQIGDDTDWPLPEGFAPNAMMLPLDDEATKLYQDTARTKQNWGRPDLNIPVAPPSTNNRPVQPIIPAPIEHFTHPSDLKPFERPIDRTIALDEKKQQERMEYLERRNQELEDAMKAQQSVGDKVSSEADKKATDDRAKAQAEADKAKAAQSKPGAATPPSKVAEPNKNLPPFGENTQSLKTDPSTAKVEGTPDKK